MSGVQVGWNDDQIEGRVSDDRVVEIGHCRARASDLIWLSKVIGSLTRLSIPSLVVEIVVVSVKVSTGGLTSVESVSFIQDMVESDHKWSICVELEVVLID